MGCDTKVDVFDHGFRACSSLIELGLWSKDAVERQMSHQERNGVRVAYIHKAEFLEERWLICNGGLIFWMPTYRKPFLLLTMLKSIIRLNKKTMFNI